MKCIAVYTDNFEQFSDMLDKVLEAPPANEEETVIEGVTVSDSGDVPEHYLERMRVKPEVVVMKVKDTDITILQHGDVFEILLPDKEPIVQ